MLVEIAIAALIVIGASFALVGSIGLVRLSDLYCRLHGPTKATTLGLGAMLLASVLHFSRSEGLSLHELLITVFLFLTAPVSAHMIARAGLHLRVDSNTLPPAAEDRDAFPATSGGSRDRDHDGIPDKG